MKKFIKHILPFLLSFSSCEMALPQAINLSPYATQGSPNVNTRSLKGFQVQDTLVGNGKVAFPLIPTSTDSTTYKPVGMNSTGYLAKMSNWIGSAPTGAAGGDLAGTYPNPTVSQSSTAFGLVGVITPTTIATGTTNNYNPTGLSTSSVIRLSASTTNDTITGLSGGVSGRIVILHNVGFNAIRFQHEGTSSTASNRFTLSSLSTPIFTLDAGASVTIQYDGTSSRWRFLSSSVYGISNAPYQVAFSGLEYGSLSYSTDFQFNPTNGRLYAGSGTANFYLDPTNSGSYYTFNKGTFSINGVTYSFTNTQGTSGSVLTNNGSGTLSWQIPTKDTIGIEFIIDGGGSAITTGIKGDLEIPFGCTITRCTMLADQSGSIVVQIWKDIYANYPPDVSDAIYASAPPTISSAIKSQDATLTGWTTPIASGSTLRFNVSSVSTIQRCTVSLKCVRN